MIEIAIVTVTVGVLRPDKAFDKGYSFHATRKVKMAAAAKPSLA